MSDTLTTLLTTAGGAYLGKFVGPAAEAMGKAAWERAQQVGSKALALLATVGREPQPVEPKLLVPLVQAASLEADPILTEKWAALLANAADPAQQAVAHPSFITVLQQLTTDDALVLAFVYANIPPSQTVELKVVDFSVELSSQRVMSHFSWTKERIGLSFENLERLKLINMFSSPPNYDMKSGIIQTTGPYITSQAFGHLFLAAVTPPTA